MKWQRNQISNCQHSLAHRESKEIPAKHIYSCITNYPKVFGWITKKLWKILNEMEVSDHPTCLLRNYVWVQKQQLEPDMEQMTGLKLGREYDKAVYCLPAYLTSMQSTSWEIPDWIKQVRIKTVGRNINNLTIAETEEELKFSLMRVRVESE